MIMNGDMSVMFEGGEQVVVNTLGHAAGVLIFGIFSYLIVKERSTPRLRVGLLSLVAAILALRILRPQHTAGRATTTVPAWPLPAFGSFGLWAEQ
jgi:hypothetical protein